MVIYVREFMDVNLIFWWVGVWVVVYGLLIAWVRWLWGRGGGPGVVVLCYFYTYLLKDKFKQPVDNSPSPKKEVKEYPSMI